MNTRILFVVMVSDLIFLNSENSFVGARYLVEEWQRYSRSAVEHTDHTPGSKRGEQQIYNKGDNNNLEFSEINEQAVKSRLDTELGTKLPLDPASAREVEKQLTSLTLQQSLEYKNALKENEANTAMQFATGMHSRQEMQNGQDMQRGQSMQTSMNMQFANPLDIHARMNMKSQHISSPFDGKSDDAAERNSENQLSSERLMTSEAMGQFNDGLPEKGKRLTQSRHSRPMQLNDVMGPNATPVQALGNLVAPPMPPTTRIVEQDANGLVKPFNVGYDGIGKPVSQLRQEFFSHGITQNVLNRMMFGGMKDVVAADKQGALFARSTAHNRER